MNRILGVWLGLWLVAGCGQPTVAPSEDASLTSSLSGAQAQERIAAGAYHSLAVRSDGTVWAWGYNRFGQLGDGTILNRTAPVQVPGLSEVVAVAAGGLHSLAVRSDGTVWAWGNNSAYGQLGDGTTTDRTAPVQVQGLSEVVTVAAGYHHSLAVRSDGTGWGMAPRSTAPRRCRCRG
jgi:alpha-tubulin suppressor-like RCC1 family protein